MPFVADKVCEMMSGILSFQPAVEAKGRRKTLTDVKAQ